MIIKQFYLKFYPLKYIIIIYFRQKNKITKEDFEIQVKAYLPEPEKQLALIYKYLASSIQNISEIGGIEAEVITDINRLFDTLGKLGLAEYIEFDPSIIRGFDYYTGFIFGIFDTNPENKRSFLSHII